MYFPLLQAWDVAGAGQNSSDSNFLNWALALIRQLLFPGKRSKDVIETGEDDSIDTDPGVGGSKDEGDVKADMSAMFDDVWIRPSVEFSSGSGSEWKI